MKTLTLAALAATLLSLAAPASAQFAKAEVKRHGTAAHCARGKKPQHAQRRGPVENTGREIPDTDPDQ